MLHTGWIALFGPLNGSVEIAELRELFAFELVSWLTRKDTVDSMDLWSDRAGMS